LIASNCSNSKIDRQQLAILTIDSIFLSAQPILSTYAIWTVQKLEDPRNCQKITCYTT